MLCKDKVERERAAADSGAEAVGRGEEDVGGPHSRGWEREKGGGQIRTAFNESEQPAGIIT